MIILVNIYKTFELTYEDSEPPEYFVGPVLTPKNGMPVRVIRRDIPTTCDS